MPELRRIAIFCGSKPGTDSRFLTLATAVGRGLAQEGIGVVYGGGHVGLMGAVADGALAAGGEVIGVIPRQLAELELAHNGLSSLHLVDSMHERKAKMAGLADGFVALPGGIGTLEEIFEQWTWGQLAIHQKPVGFLDSDRFYAPLQTMLATMRGQGFVSPAHSEMVVFASTLQELLAAFRGYTPPAQKWKPGDAVQP